MRNFIYDIWLCAEKNGVDLTVGLSMFDADARNGTADDIHPDTDREKIAARFAELSDTEKHTEAFKDVSNFMRKHYDALVDCFKERSREQFDKLVSELTKQDEEAAKLPDETHEEAERAAAERAAAKQDKTEDAESAPDVVEDTAVKEV